MPTRSRQARWAAAKRAARGPLPKGRPPWTCPACGGTDRSVRADNSRQCTNCFPPGRRGRPKKPLRPHPKPPE
jgi:hypothetical protein